MRKLLLQLDSSRLPSVFDRIVAFDSGADEVMSYGGITEADVRDLIYGCIFTRGPKDLKHTAVFIGGSDMAAGEGRPPPAQRPFFRPVPGLPLPDPNGTETPPAAPPADMPPTRRARRGHRGRV